MGLHVTVREANGSTQVLVRPAEGAVSEPCGTSLPFTSPLSITDFDDLRFYLEDYAALPVGEYAVRGERVERERLSSWGEALFASIFGGDPDRSEACREAQEAADRREPVEFEIRSNDAKFLALPWELMKAPGHHEPIALGVNSFDRSLVTAKPARQFASTEEGFRVLMVIARPDGISDVPFQAVARPLFQRLEQTNGGVRIEVLRPPSFQEFRQRLKAAQKSGKPYHAVHFDGHGIFGQSNFSKPQGHVLFESRNGRAEAISARDFSAAVTAGGVPLVILNACQSGKIETADSAAGPRASIATRLLADGAASVVAMSHIVYVAAAAEFMTVFYRALFNGRSVSEAVTEGRKALSLEQNRLRPSLKGRMPLQDWMVPVHYARSVLRLPQGETKPAPASAAGETAAKVLGAAQIGEGHAADDLAAEDGVFFGRDAEFFILERAIHTHGLAIIHGVGGTGKTELAKAFARWQQISGGLADPRLVFFHEFLPGRPTFGLDAILGEMLERIGKTELYLQASDTKTRAKLVLKELTRARSLLIWDNFETVASMPEPGQATPPLDEAKKAELKWFIGELRKSKSALLITSRSEERWLSGPEVFVRCEVGGLRERDALQYADHLLAPHAQASARRAAEPTAFKELIDNLGGHPLSLKLILPRLSEASPSALLAELKSQAALPAGFGATEGRLKSLGASIHYSFRHLPEEDQRRLVILSLFEKVVSANILGTMKNVPAQFQGPDPNAWAALLDQLSDLGLLTSIGGALYFLHPALPRYLGALWQSQAEAVTDVSAEREAALRSLIGAAAIFAVYLKKQVDAGEAWMALAQIATLRPSLSAFLAAALERDLFTDAQALIQALDEYWDVAGLAFEAAAWCDQVIKATEPHPGQAPEIETPAHDLWLFVRGADAIRALGAGDLARAEEIYHGIEASFKRRDGEKAKRCLAFAFHQLGRVAQARGRHDEAEGWYQKSLAIEQALGNQPGIATSFHQLGMVAQDRGRHEEAEAWYKKSLVIEQALGDQPGIASSYHQLGIAALELGRLDEAEGWYKNSLTILEALSNQPGLAASYHQLGRIAQARGHYDEAEGWYKRSLAIKAALDNQPGLATSYHELGMVAQDRGRLDEAEGWYEKSLAIYEAMGEVPNKTIVLNSLLRLKVVQGESGRRPSYWSKLRRTFT